MARSKSLNEIPALPVSCAVITFGSRTGNQNDKLK
jgi:hypothetical protein